MLSIEIDYAVFVKIKGEELNTILRLGLCLAVLVFPLTSSYGEVQHRGFVYDPEPDPSINDILDLIDTGANIIRYVFSKGVNGADNLTIAEYREWLFNDLDNFDAMHSALKDAGVKVLFSMHMPVGGFEAQNVTWPKYRIFGDESFQAEFVTIWEEIAERYKDEDITFEILNEPMIGVNPADLPGVSTLALKSWDDLAAEVVQAIRAIDPDRELVLSGPYADVSYLQYFKLPQADNLVVSVHTYWPNNYTHQKLGKFKKTIRLWTKKFPKKALKKRLKMASDYGKANNVTMAITEFGVVNWAPKPKRWLKQIIKFAEKHNFSNWIVNVFAGADVWDPRYKGKGPDDLEFVGIENTKTGKYLLKRFLKN